MENSTNATIEDEAAFLTALDERINNPPERYLSAEKFLDLIEQTQ
jgi:hypothetical protein